MWFVCAQCCDGKASTLVVRTSSVERAGDKGSGVPAHSTKTNDMGKVCKQSERTSSTRTHASIQSVSMCDVCFVCAREKVRGLNHSGEINVVKIEILCIEHV